MKKLLVFLILSLYMLGAVTTSAVSKVSLSVNGIIAQLSNTEAEVNASTVTNGGLNVNCIDDSKSIVAGQLDIPKQNLNNQSIYSKYFSEISKKNREDKVFGIDIINNSGQEELPVTVDKEYILSFGDLISIKVWSDIYMDNKEASSANLLSLEVGKNLLSLEVGKTGNVFIPNIGSFYVVGKSIKTLQNEIINEGKKKLKYFNADITLEKIREIKIFISGEVNKPGYITGTPYSNLFNLLNKTQGVTLKASLRNIKLVRNGQQVSIDLYDYINGNKKINELKLQDGDTIFVPVANNYVLIEGEVNKAGLFEIGNEKDYKALVNLAGGYTKFSNKNNVESYAVVNDKIEINTSGVNEKINNSVFKISINRIDENNRNEIYILGAVVNPGVYSYEKEFTYKDLLKKSGGYIKESVDNIVTIIRGKENKKVINFNPNNENPKLNLGDEVYIYNYMDINNKPYATIQGAVINPGTYEVYEGTRVINLLYSSRGLNEKLNPYMNRVDIFRIDENGRLEVFKVNLNKVLAGDEIENILLRRDDTVKIYTYDEVVKYDDIYIYGEVREPGKYRYYENMTIEDIVFYAKGLLNKADNNIIISRNDISTQKIVEYNIDINRNPDFKILEGDSIFIRKKSEWIDTKIVNLNGFVKYPGSYQLNEKETVSSLINRAGGFKEGAFPEGLQLNRVTSKVVINEMTKSSKEIAIMEKVSNLEYNSKMKIFTRDIELKHGDVINIPEKPTYIKIDGEVYTPGYVVYDKGIKDYKKYIGAAGGYKETAYKKKTFVIKANGKTYENPKDTKIEPGDTIYVPVDTRVKKGFERAMEAFKGTLEIVSSVALIIVLF